MGCVCVPVSYESKSVDNYDLNHLLYGRSMQCGIRRQIRFLISIYDY